MRASFQRLLSSAWRVAAGVPRRLLWPLQRPRVRARLTRRREAPAAGDRGHVVFFSPEAGVTPHFAAQCVLARTLRDLGHPVLFVRCHEGFVRCPVMDMYQLPYAEAARKADVCLRCAADSMRMLDAYGLESFDLSTLDGPTLRETVRAALASAPADLRDFTFDSVPFGRLSALDLVLSHKVADLGRVSEPVRLAWQQYVEASLRSYLLVGELCERTRVSRLLYFNDYSLMLGARLAANKRGVPVVGVTQASHRNIDRRRFVLVPEAASMIYLKQGESWPRWRELALPGDVVREIGDDVLTRLGGRGSHLYSPAKTFGADDLHARLGFTRGKRLLVAFTSSLDEMMATRVTRAALGHAESNPPLPFADQIDWLGALTNFVAGRDDLELAVRVHPREGVNKRDKIVSQHLGRLKAAFGRPPRGCTFIWPEDKVSSYDLAEMADLALTSWSTIGLELARLGVPVLAWAQRLTGFAPDDFLEGAETPAEYFEKLLALLDRPADLGTVARAFRWYHLLHLGTSLDLADVVPRPDCTGLPPFRLPAEARAVEEVVVGGRHVLDLNHARLAQAQRPDSAEEESRSLRRQLGRFVRYFLTGVDSPLAGGSLLVREGPVVRVTEGDRTWTRYSPLCARLAPVCGQDAVRSSEAREVEEAGRLATGS
jgi:hypothetical protein